MFWAALAAPGDHVHPGLEADAGHADGLADALLAVDDEFLGQHVEDLLVGGNGHRPRRVDHPVHVALGHLPVADGDDAVGIQAADVAAGDAGIDLVDVAARHQLRLLDRALDGGDRGLDVDDHALLQPLATGGCRSR